MIKDVSKLHIKTQWMIECPHCDGEGWLFGDSREGVVGLAEDVIEFL